MRYLNRPFNDWAGPMRAFRRTVRQAMLRVVVQVDSSTATGRTAS